jgi:hypothetical protein
LGAALPVTAVGADRCMCVAFVGAVPVEYFFYLIDAVIYY